MVIQPLVELLPLDGGVVGNGGGDLFVTEGLVNAGHWTLYVTMADDKLTRP